MNTSWTRRVLVAGALAAGLLAASPLDAHAKGKPAPRAVTCSCALSAPSTAALGQDFAITGAGYQPGVTVWLQVVTPTSNGWMSVAVAADGSISTSFAGWTAGTYRFTAYQNDVARATATVQVG